MLFPEHKRLDLPAIDRQILEKWKKDRVFAQSILSRPESKPFVFYEGPPSANGMPGIHHVLSRTLKDIFCRYQTLKGFRVDRKGGWDTHGLPVELGVEKKLGITKENIGKTISVAEYNRICREEVLKFKDAWDQLTEMMGYWVDLEHPYITFENNYIESLWNLIQRLYDKDLLYKGDTIQPYSPAAGTGLSSHELNLPGCYKSVKDTSAVVQFRLKTDAHYHRLFPDVQGSIDVLAWTTTPWTLPSNTALAVHPNIDYVLVKSYHPYTQQLSQFILAEALLGKYFKGDAVSTLPEADQADFKELSYIIIQHLKGTDLSGLQYESLFQYATPTDGDAWRIIAGDFVTTEDGTGIVHIAPSFGADDRRVARQNGIGSLTLVDKQGRFTDEVTDFAGEYVKSAYYTEEELEMEKKRLNLDRYLSVDERISILLKKTGKAFRVEKYEHNYPHCWRTGKPILYYPLDSWFIRTTAFKERLVALNKTIRWKPESTGTGRFGNWLENLVDWNLSRSRFWGTPLPIWRTEDGSETRCIGSKAELKDAIRASVEKGWMPEAALAFEYPQDLHKPYVDEIILVSKDGKPMHREPDLIDVWFDSGAMPYAQWHFPFEQNPPELSQIPFPADFIAEGVDQTRGWFFTLHAIAVLLFNQVAFRQVISHGLVLDKHGNKMSKSLGNTVDPFEILNKYGADATRWYMISNAQPWDNLRFDPSGIEEVQRKFLGTLFNTYVFFSLYANIDGYQFDAQKQVKLSDRPEIDRWIIARLELLKKQVYEAMDDLEPTKAARLIQGFVDEHLSNWYVRLCRRRFWKGELNQDKQSAYDTLFTCLHQVSVLMSPMAPFFADWLFQNLKVGMTADVKTIDSVHLSLLDPYHSDWMDESLIRRMALAQQLSSMVLSIRKKVNIKVRQPLSRVLIPLTDPTLKEDILQVADLIRSETNVKKLEFVENIEGVVVLNVKPDFKKLGARLGKKIKTLQHQLETLPQSDIFALDKNGRLELQLEGESFVLHRDEVDIRSEDMPGWQIAQEDSITVALDIQLNDELIQEGHARELINKIQNLRKEQGFDVTDRILMKINAPEDLKHAFQNFQHYICTEILATQIEFVHFIDHAQNIDINESEIFVQIFKQTI